MSEGGSANSRRTIVNSMLLGALGCFLSAGLLQIEILSFALWSIPFIGGVALLAAVLSRYLSPLNFSWRLLLSSVLGAIVAYCWAWLPVFALGPWSMNLGPVGIAWATGGMVAIVTATNTPGQRNGEWSASNWLAVAVLSVVITLGYRPLYGLVTGYRDASVVFVRWEPGPGSTIIDDDLELLDTREETQLQQLGLAGKLTSEGSGGGGIGLPRVEIIVIMQKPLDQSKYLPYPILGQITYVQEGGDWRQYPVNAWISSHGIELLQNSDGSTGFRLEFPGGGQSWGGGIAW